MDTVGCPSPDYLLSRSTMAKRKNKTPKGRNVIAVAAITRSGCKKL